MLLHDWAIREQNLFDAGRRAAVRSVGALLVWVGLIGLAVLSVAGSAGAQPLPGRTSAQGEELYHQQCAWCHGRDGAGTDHGPALLESGLASAHFYLTTGRMPLHQPDDPVERGEPSYSEDQIASLLAYLDEGLEVSGPPVPVGLADLQPGQVDLAAGGVLYRLHCASCHNWDGKGGAMTDRVNAPPLHPATALQVADAIRAGPGGMPAFGDQVLDDRALREVVGYVLYLREPRDVGGWPLAHWGPSTEMLAALVALGGMLLVTAALGDRAT